MITIRGYARYGPGEIERLKTQLNAYAEHVRRLDGCIDYHYALDLAEPDCLHVIQAWRDEAAYAAYLNDLGEIMNILAGAKMEVIGVKAYDSRYIKTVMPD